MVLYPEVQKKAQAEIDAVVGTSRLPTLDDKKDLPYITACMKELLRWHVSAPQGELFSRLVCLCSVQVVSVDGRIYVCLDV